MSLFRIARATLSLLLVLTMIGAFQNCSQLVGFSSSAMSNDKSGGTGSGVDGKLYQYGMCFGVENQIQRVLSIQSQLKIAKLYDVGCPENQGTAIDPEQNIFSQLQINYAPGSAVILSADYSGVTYSPSSTSSSTPSSAADVFPSVLPGAQFSYHVLGLPVDGQTWRLNVGGYYIQHRVQFAADGTYTFDLIGYTDYLDTAHLFYPDSIGAVAEIRLDNVPVGRAELASLTPVNALLTGYVTAGPHELTIVYVNDAYSPEIGVDRDLFVTKLTITKK